MSYTHLNQRLRVLPLEKRESKTSIAEIAVNPDFPPPTAGKHLNKIKSIAERMRQARENGAAIILAFGAHLVKNGLAPLVIRMMEEGWLTHLATNGAGGIHDWEFAWLGRSEEDVRANVAMGQFGTWEETGRCINLAVQIGSSHGKGYGESLGALIYNEHLDVPTIDSLKNDLLSNIDTNDTTLAAKLDLLQNLRALDTKSGAQHIPHKMKHYSLLGNAYRLGLPITVHPGIGYDIIYNSPYALGAALGRAAHIDYHKMVASILELTDGVFLSVGSAIMAPQIFEKALSFANNLRLQESRSIISNHSLVVNDLQESAWDWTQGEPPKSSPDYYLRFLKSFYRMGGNVFYIAADNRLFLHNLYYQLKSNN